MKSPAFQFYPKDYLTDSNVIPMTLEEQGAYCRLIFFCWLEGNLSPEISKLAKFCGVTARKMETLWPAISPCFQVTPDGQLTHKRLEKERIHQAQNREKREKAAQIRWDKERAKADASAMQMHGHEPVTNTKDTMHMHCTPTPTPTPTSTAVNKEQEHSPDGEEGVVGKRTRGNSRKKAAESIVDLVGLPAWLPVHVWERWVQYRKEIRKPLVETTVSAQIRALEKLRDLGNPPEDVIDQSIANSWQGFFAIRGERNGSNNGSTSTGKNGSGSGEGAGPAYDPWAGSEKL